MYQCPYLVSLARNILQYLPISCMPAYLYLPTSFHLIIVRLSYSLTRIFSLTCLIVRVIIRLRRWFDLPAVTMLLHVTLASIPTYICNREYLRMSNLFRMKIRSTIRSSSDVTCVFSFQWRHAETVQFDIVLTLILVTALTNSFRRLEFELAIQLGCLLDRFDRNDM